MMFCYGRPRKQIQIEIKNSQKEFNSRYKQVDVKKKKSENSKIKQVTLSSLRSRKKNEEKGTQFVISVGHHQIYQHQHTYHGSLRRRKGRKSIKRNNDGKLPKFDKRHIYTSEELNKLQAR